MPPRFTYWTIIFGNQPTSFRAATREELLPTFKQIQSKHPDAVMMWFARGRLWKSEEEMREAMFRRREERAPRAEVRRAKFGAPRSTTGDRRPPSGDRRPPSGDRRPPSGDRGPNAKTVRGRDWRPGGEHKDPRDRFKVPRDVKRARFKAKAQRDRAFPKPAKKKDDE
jgi:hypothetical protein